MYKTNLIFKQGFGNVNNIANSDSPSRLPKCTTTKFIGISSDTRKRSNPSTTSVNKNQNGFKKIRTAYLDLMNDSRNCTIDPLSCIPLTKIRLLTKRGVKRLKRLMGGDKSGDKPGIFASSDTPVVIPLTGSMYHHVQEHFESLGLSSTEVEVKIKERELWYGIVDGMHRHRAIMELM